MSGLPDRFVVTGLCGADCYHTGVCRHVNRRTDGDGVDPEETMDVDDRDIEFAELELCGYCSRDEAVAEVVADD